MVNSELDIKSAQTQMARHRPEDITFGNSNWKSLKSNHNTNPGSSEQQTVKVKGPDQSSYNEMTSQDKTVVRKAPGITIGEMDNKSGSDEYSQADF